MTSVMVVEEAKYIDAGLSKAPHRWNPTSKTITTIEYLSIPFFCQLIHFLVIAKEAEVTEVTDLSPDLIDPFLWLRHPGLINPRQCHAMIIQQLL